MNSINWRFLLFFIELTPWTPWTSCSKTCGSGERTRERKCEFPNQRKNSNPCGNAPLFEREVCNSQKCPIFTEWSDWGQCSESCGGGKQSRDRACVLPPIPSLYSKGKLICNGPSLESRYNHTWAREVIEVEVIDAEVIESVVIEGGSYRGRRLLREEVLTVRGG